MTLAVFDQGPPPPCPHPFNMAAYVLAAGAQTPDKVALIIAGVSAAESFTFGQIIARVRGFGGALLDRGLQPGARILLRLGNTSDFPIAYLGAIAVGMVPIPTSAQLTEPEVARIIEETDPGLICHAPDVPCPPDNRAIGPDEIAAMQRHAPAEYHMGDPDRLGYIVYTSGTSGQPRAVCHAHRAIWARRMMHQGWYGLSGEDRMLHAGAFNWTFTLGTGVMDPWSVGATSIVAAPGTAIESLPVLLKTHQASLFAAAPAVFRKLLKSHPTLDVPTLRHALTAGEKMPPAVAADWTRASGTAIYEAYGQSEISTFISASPDRPGSPDTLGSPQIGRRVAITDENGAPVALDAPGRICIHRSDPGLMLGYLGDPPIKDGPEWFDTGDQGAMAADGQIRYLGRGDDLMNAGGYRVSPLEVEAALHDAPGLDAIAVTQIEVKADTKIIVAFYTAAQAADDAALDTYAHDRLAGYKTPRAYVHIDAMPTGPNGKLSRKALAQYWKS